MDFEVKNIQKNIVVVARELGYVIIDNNGEQYNLVRKLTRENYPRFHAYVKVAGPFDAAQGKNKTNFIFSLHLDQKKPSYEGSHAHSGEYFGPIIDEEADRIREVLSMK